MFSRWGHPILLALLGFTVLGAGLLALAVLLIYPSLPSLEALTHYQPKVPLRVYTIDGALIGEFGEERRALVKIDTVPKRLQLAVLAAEDERFYRHGGVDYMGVLRASLANVSAGEVKEGASTITMQVARNFYLSREKTLTRKLSEALLALKIEGSLSKDQILEIYMNQIYLGQRAYGFAAASQVYFGRPLAALNLAETAMLAGLPKAPSRYNPITDPERAKLRQEYVLGRMHKLHFISQDEYNAALKQDLRVRRERRVFDVSADHVAEMVRQALYAQYKEDIYSKGLKVFTTLRKDDQLAAHAALRRGVIDYEKRHGYRGPEGWVELGEQAERNGARELDKALEKLTEVNGLIPAVVLQANPKRVLVYTQGGEFQEITVNGLQFVQKALQAKTGVPALRRGALVRVQRDDQQAWEIVQLPRVEAALVSLDPHNGAIRALVGGFDFTLNKYNHVNQAWRQPGSSFKPFIYSASLDKGFTPATVINDAPVVLSAAATGSEVWHPKNYDASYDGPMRMRNALAKSKNMVSIRILQAIGTRYAQDYITRFGFSKDKHPPYLTMALGAGSVTALEMVTAYAVFANGGFYVKPFFIECVVDAQGTVLWQGQPAYAERDAPRVLDPRNAFIMTSMMRDVVERGTGARAMQLGRNDLAGKTGTTNDQMDAWFAGYNTSLVAVSWMGFDQPRSLGSVETGAQAALPIWMGYMARVLKGVPEQFPSPPPGVTSTLINPASGLRAEPGGESVPEYFYEENVPTQQHVPGTENIFSGTEKAVEELKEQLF
ncbi:MAG: penicillin-binding protein 1A [Burkholderiales bacterium]